MMDLGLVHLRFLQYAASTSLFGASFFLNCTRMLMRSPKGRASGAEICFSGGDPGFG
jgi:hypothetical protein